MRPAARAAFPLVVAGAMAAGAVLAPADALLVAPLAGGASFTFAGASTASSTAGPRVRHVFVVNIENKGYTETWGAGSQAPYLARTLRNKGVLLRYYYGTAHHSQPNYVAQISGQGPDAQMQGDCGIYSAFHEVGTTPPQQAVGTGCVFPKNVNSLPQQMSHHHLSWKGYMDDMARGCQHPRLNTRDRTEQATARHEYATRHDPFVYFRSITSRPRYCARHVVKLRRLRTDLASARATPHLAYITPDLCNDGHDSPCADGRPGGLVTVNTWMKRWIPRILGSPAFQRNGLLVITADESDGGASGSTACCGEGPSANTPQPGIDGPGGGRIGALVLSPWTRGGTATSRRYNHYSLLASIENVFGLKHLGYARTRGLNTFGPDIYNKP